MVCYSLGDKTAKKKVNTTPGRSIVWLAGWVAGLVEAGTLYADGATN